MFMCKKYTAMSKNQKSYTAIELLRQQGNEKIWLQPAM